MFMRMWRNNGYGTGTPFLRSSLSDRPVTFILTYCSQYQSLPQLKFS
jgi:hypothetical protein